MTLCKPRPILQDMPFHIKKRIGNKLESFFDKMTLRKVSPGFREAIGDPEYNMRYLELIYLNTKDPKIEVTAKGSSDTYFLKFTQLEEERKCKIEWTINRNRIQKFELMVENGHFIYLMAEKLASLFDNPNFKLEVLNLGDNSLYSPFASQYSDSEANKLNQYLFLRRIAEVLKNLNRKLKIDEFRIDCFGEQDNVLKILQYIDADHLRSLQLKRTSNLIDRVDKLIETEHWKKVKKLGMFDLPKGKLPVEAWWDYEDIFMELCFIEPNELAKVIQHFRISKNFKYCVLSTNISEAQFEIALGRSRTWHRTANGRYTEFPADMSAKRLFVLFERGGWVTIGRSMSINRRGQVRITDGES